MNLSDAFDKILMEELKEEMMKDDKWLHDKITEKENKQCPGKMILKR